MIRPLRICMVAACPLPAPRGTPSRILRLAEALARRGHDVQLVAYPNYDPDIPVVAELSLSRVKLPFRYARLSPGPSPLKPLVDVYLTRLLSRLLAERSFDVLHAHHVEGLAASVLANRRRRTPLVYDSHTDVASEFVAYLPRPWGRLFGALAARIERQMIGRAAQVIAVTPRLRDRYARWGIAPARLSVVPTGTDARFLDDPLPAAELPGLPDAFPIITYTGSLAGYQGLDDLLAGMAIVVRHISGARLIVFTTSAASTFTKRVVARGLGSCVTVIYQQSLDQLAAVMARSDILVSPRSHSYGIPQKLANYMASGRPIVAFAGSASLLRDGETGVVVPDRDVRAFADAICALARDADRRERLGRASRQAVRALTWDVLVEDVEAVYAAALAGRLGSERA